MDSFFDWAKQKVFSKIGSLTLTLVLISIAPIYSFIENQPKYIFVLSIAISICIASIVIANITTILVNINNLSNSIDIEEKIFAVNLSQIYNLDTKSGSLIGATYDVILFNNSQHALIYQIDDQNINANGETPTKINNVNNGGIIPAQSTTNHAFQTIILRTADRKIDGNINFEISYGKINGKIYKKKYKISASAFLDDKNNIQSKWFNNTEYKLKK
jgi:hypothetical protein